MNDDSENKQPGQPPPKKDGFWRRFFAHPLVQGIAFAAGIIGFYAYYDSIREPDLTYYLSPTRAPILQTGQLDDFSLTYHGIDVTGNLSSAEIQIWNAGRLPIKKEDILTKQISLYLSNNIPIYKVTATPSRNVIGFDFVGDSNPNSTPYIQHQVLMQAQALATIKYESNGLFTITGSTNPYVAVPDKTNDVLSFLRKPPVPALRFSWDVLEQGDAVKLQIIYGGKPDARIFLDGIILGQKEFTHYTSETGRGFKFGIVTTPKRVVVSVSVLGLVVVLSYVFLFKTAPKSDKKFLINSIVTAFLIALFLATGLFEWFLRFVLQAPNPPFGF